MNAPSSNSHQSPECCHRTIRMRMHLTGILQGIGCRPTVFRVATGLGLGGWVVNTTAGVIIEIEGSPERCAAFLNDLPPSIPHPGRIETSVVRNVPPLGEKTFRIETSVDSERTITPIPPDVATCPECVRELLDPRNRRHLYPFITCTLCGPRFTVVRSFPYDRERTSMADFTMCEACRQEYEDPGDRRFHSQTNACSECGPSLRLTDAHGRGVDGDPVVQTVRFLAHGRIVAVKGIGGFHLACDALNEDAVRLLRDRKGREEKPFAVMVPDLATAKRYCQIGQIEERLLSSPIAPIVLLRTRGERLAPNVAPFVGTLGVMLPYSPIHHLLFRHPDVPPVERPPVLVMTSGNRSEEPIARDNDEALERLGDLADAFLMHDREIVLRTDDSIYRVIGGIPTVFRRSRGLVPGDFRFRETIDEEGRGPLPSEDAECSNCSGESGTPVVLAAGGDLKNAPAIVKGGRAVPGPHVGDLVSTVAQDYFGRSVSVLSAYLEAQPEAVAVDPHPEYFSSSLARGLGVPSIEVFHHHAHAASLLFEHGLDGPALFAVFDGTGYGTDGTIWGGEFLSADMASFTRKAHIGLFPLPGGEAAIRDPLRILAGLLTREHGIPEVFSSLFEDRAAEAKIWLEAVHKGINAPMTSSAGRFFDAAAAATGFGRRVTFEGEAAMWLEAIADPTERGDYRVRIIEGDPMIVDATATIEDLAWDRVAGVEPAVIAARFHNSMSRMVAVTAQRLRNVTGLDVFGLTGGCFQNRLFTEKTAALLEESGFRVLQHGHVPPNDGGIALGQASVARNLLGKAEVMS